MSPLRARTSGLGAALALVFACSGPPTPERPNVVLVVIDNLRADHLGAFGYGRPTSPGFDELAERGLLFTRAYAPSSWTKPSVAALFTSLPPEDHAAVSFERQLRADVPTLAEHLARGGYQTVGVSGNFVHVSPETGLARGFARFDVLAFPVAGPDENSIFAAPRRDGGMVHLRAPRASEVNRAVLSQLPAAGEQPLFLYVHYMDPHAGFDPPRAHLRAVVGAGPLPDGVTSDQVVALARRGADANPEELTRLRDLYDGEIASVDAALDDLLGSLAARGWLERAVVAVVSDHGEEFGEHGGFFHGLNLHAESLHVPLLIWDTRPGASAGRRGDPVDLLDVAPTLLALAGLSVPQDMRGRDLLGQGALPPRELVAALHCDPPFETYVRPRVQWSAVTRWPWKLIVDRDGERRWYDLERDPGEQVPVAPASVPAEVRSAGEALARRTVARDRAACARAPVLDDEVRDGLRALGYVE